MINIQETIDTLSLLKNKGYIDFNVTISDGWDSVDANNIYFNEGILTDGTKVVDLDVTTTLMTVKETYEPRHKCDDCCWEDGTPKKGIGCACGMNDEEDA